MIERSDWDGNVFVIYCDEVGCDHSEEYGTDGDWQDMIDEAKADKWKMRYDPESEEWYHKCPSCGAGENNNE